MWRQARKAWEVITLAQQFKVDEIKLLTLWLADKVLDALEGDDDKLKLEAIKVAKVVLD